MSKVKAIALIGLTYIGFIATCFLALYGAMRLLEKMGVVVG
jgi:hypothetical protein